MRRVIIEADPAARATDAQLMALTVPNLTGDMVPLSAIAAPHWTVGPVMLNRYDGYPSLDVSGRAATHTDDRCGGRNRGQGRGVRSRRR